MNRRPGPRSYTPPADPTATAIMPTPDAHQTTVMPFQTLRDALATSGRPKPASALELPLWRSATAPNAPGPAAPPARTEQTDIRDVTHQVVAHVYRHRFNECHTDLEAIPAAVAADHADIIREATTAIAAIMAELDAVAEGMGFRTASVRRLGRSLATGGMSPDDVLAELHALG